jgi:hypothetical protein
MKSAGEDDCASIYLRPASCLDLLFLKLGLAPLAHTELVLDYELRTVIEWTRIDWKGFSPAWLGV